MTMSLSKIKGKMSKLPVNNNDIQIVDKNIWTLPIFPVYFIKNAIFPKKKLHEVNSYLIMIIIFNQHKKS